MSFKAFNSENSEGVNNNSNANKTTNNSSNQSNDLANQQNTTSNIEKDKPGLLDIINSLIGITDSNDDEAYIDSSGTIHYKNKNPIQTDLGYFNSTLQYTTPSQSAKILDKMKKVSDDYTQKPLSYKDTINKNSKTTRTISQDIYKTIGVDFYNVRIGDVEFNVPPEYISVIDSSNTITNIALRQDSTMKAKTGHSDRKIVLTLLLNGIENINGNKIDSPFDYDYYTDGILAMIAQFKCTPFLPIINEYININFNIYTVGLLSMSIETVEGFPNCLQMAIVLQEFDSTPLTEINNIYYQDLIDWDLQRYYYQRYINKKLKPIESNASDSLTIEMLDIQKINDTDSKKLNILDSKLYSTVLDKKYNKFSVSNVAIEISNIFSLQQMQSYKSPTMQFLGGNDVSVIITIETKDNSVVQLLNNMLTTTQTLTRNLSEYSGIGFVKIKNSLINMFGFNHYMINNLTTETVPGLPGLSLIRLECISYNAGKCEILKGFRPFEGDSLGVKDDAISKDKIGLTKKIRQDNIIERKLTTLNLYPDLYLPTYKEVDEAISKINSFKTKHSMPKLKYSKANRTNSIDPGNGPDGVYEGYVDPDFYFLYNVKYSNISSDMFAEIKGSESTVNNFIRNRKKVEETEYADKKDITKKSVSDQSNIARSAFINKSPYVKPTTQNTVIGRAFAIGESIEEFEEAWKLGNETWGIGVNGAGGSIGGSGTGVGGTGVSGNVLGVGHKVEDITGNAVADLALSVLGRSWYFWGAFGGEEITQEYYDKMARQSPKKNRHAEQRAAIGKGWLAFDCSSLASWCLRVCGAKPKNFRRTSSNFVSDFDMKVTKDQLQPGDILRRTNHIGVYIGNGETVEANSQKKGVNRCKLSHYTSFGRYNNVPKTSELINKMNQNSSSTNKSKVDMNKEENRTGDESNAKPIVKTDFAIFAPIDQDGSKVINNKPNSSSGSSNNTAGEQGIIGTNSTASTCNVTPEMINKLTKGMLANTGGLYCKYGQEYNVNPALAAAIAIHEADFGNSNAIKTKYNT